MIDQPGINECFDTGGVLATAVPRFAPRPQQVHLANAIADAFDEQGVLIGEAGTGTGKTFAYLVPALLSGQRVIISTGTKHLQDQLFLNDLPVVAGALARFSTEREPRVRLLKGRANYLCRHRLVRASMNPALRDRKNQQYLQTLNEWSRQTESGDIAEVIGIPDDASIWGYITSQNDFCSEHEADELSDCFVHKARQLAQKADVVVVNHHLLCADLALKDEGHGELLPSAQGFIIDEAHQLPDIAAEFFGQKVTSRQLNELARDTIATQQIAAAEMREIRDAADLLQDAIRHFRLAFGVNARREAWVDVKQEGRVEAELDRLVRVLETLTAQLYEVVQRDKGLDQCHRRASQLLSQLKRLCFSPSTTNEHDDVSEHDSGHYVYWIETSERGFSLNMTPLNVAKQFRQAMQALPATWVFTSATLAVGGDFSHFKARLGIEESAEVLVDSPFDYAGNALLYLPENLPEPAAPEYTEQLLQACLPVLKASRGRAFLLFTSYRALNIAERYLSTHTDFVLHCQGSAPKRELVEAFQSMPNALLLGTNSFWEGVDVRGSALSCVIIDKLPFGSPADPLMSARIARMREDGGNPFFEFQVPQAAIALKQGVGRLIRDVSDRGVLVLCDPRIQTRNYGRVFVESLPPMPITRDLPEVENFLTLEPDPV